MESPSKQPADEQPRPQSSASNADADATTPFPDIAVTPSAAPTRATASRALRIRRLPSSSNINRTTSREGYFSALDEEPTGRRRSQSAPQPPQINVQPPERAVLGRDPNLPSLTEDTTVAGPPQSSGLRPESAAGRPRGASNAASRKRDRASSTASRSSIASQEYEADVIDFLDVIDPEVSTLNTLNNVQNSLFIPYLGSRFSRQPTYDLTRHTTSATKQELGQGEFIRRHRTRADSRTSGGAPDTTQLEDVAEDSEKPDTIQEETTHESTGSGGFHKVTRTHTLQSVMSSTSEEGHNYAVLPHGIILEGWSDEDKEELNDHVRHLLHSRKEGLKRRWRGFKKYIQKPLGLFVTIYSFLLFWWGLAWVLFLIGWISVGDRQPYFIEICDQILTALFALVGIGLAPFRAVDTYHTIYIVHYHFLTWKLRRKKGLPELVDPNELPEPKPGQDVELGREKSLEEPVLTDLQQAKLIHHQTKLAQSHTFYKPHETYTHYAFPVKLLLTIIILLDCHSCFQMALGGTTWGIKYTHRPKALTAVILTCSILCNISGGVVISIGDHKSRKKRIVEQLNRQEITAFAIKEMREERGLPVRSSLAENARPEVALGLKDPNEYDESGKKMSNWQRNWKGHWHPRIPKPHKHEWEKRRDGETADEGEEHGDALDKMRTVDEDEPELEASRTAQGLPGSSGSHVVRNSALQTGFGGLSKVGG